VGILGLLAAIVQHARILTRLSQPNFAYNAMAPDCHDRCGCTHADRGVRIDRDFVVIHPMHKLC
jgi:hypothetical protein